ncbi:NADH-quinone oxidoreductase subunit C [Capsulimonas corticalis]|uniref:NADH-quinone oxidoreductase subunit C n=1 Tax=Capsulimonas corticalis TaxID=2219043 RepID=A0A402CYJ0_9BACT|nr:NADH-quinone oxidoreductase subunit C [Capsulimonas corticalis]BDI31357.1 NADH-quinone oxidoreductase subunit C [Capsulimonas corticalis]
MVDFNVRLGLTPTDLELREIQTKRPAEFEALNADDSPELRLLEEQFAGEIVSSRLFRGEKTITVKKDKIVAIAKALRDTHETAYNYLSDLTCVDLLKVNKTEEEPRFEVLYNLYSLATFERLRLKAQVTEDDPTIDTVESVWPNANWNEREVYDMFGITFNNHSDLRRILMPDDWVGNPLRKDYPLGGEEVEFTFNVRGR